MSWTLHISRVVVQGARKLPKPVFAAVGPFILNLDKNPMPQGSKPVVGTPDAYEISVRGVRILWLLIPDKRIIRVITIQITQ